MPDISKELTDIMNARYGKDVRQSLHDGLEKVNNNLEDVGVDELLDARIGFDGKNYPSAGDAIRGQIENTIKKLSGFVTDDNIEPYDDLNMLPNNIFTWYNKVTSLKNAPPIHGHFTLLSYNASGGNNSDQKPGTTQIAVETDLNKNGRMYYRYCWASSTGDDSWSDWIPVATLQEIKKTILKVDGMHNKPTEDYIDMNNLPNNIFTWYLNASAHNLLNTPTNTHFTLLSYNASGGNNSDQKPGTTQIAVETDLNKNGRMYYRYCWASSTGDDSWSDWIPVATLKDIADKIEEQKKVQYDHMIRKPLQLQDKIAAFVGDSITYGNTSGTASTPNTWPKLLNDIVGFSSYVNYAVGGALITDGVNEIKSITQQVKEVTNKANDIMFIAGGINDWQLSVSIDDFKVAMEDLCDYINSNYANDYKVIFITPINHAKNPKNSIGLTIRDYADVITRTCIEKDIHRRFSIIQGDKFNFPKQGDDSEFISTSFGDQLHPSENGYANIYVPGVLNSIF